MTKGYEQLKRAMWLGFQREQALEEGITLAKSGPGYAAFCGTKEDGSVWVWDELTKSVNQVAPAGTVDVATLPDQAKRGPKPQSGF